MKTQPQPNNVFQRNDQSDGLDAEETVQRFKLYDKLIPRTKRGFTLG